jgi:hypothetical protein
MFKPHWIYYHFNRTEFLIFIYWAIIIYDLKFMGLIINNIILIISSFLSCLQSVMIHYFVLFFNYLNPKLWFKNLNLLVIILNWLNLIQFYLKYFNFECQHLHHGLKSEYLQAINHSGFKIFEMKTYLAFLLVVNHCVVFSFFIHFIWAIYLPFNFINDLLQ